MSIQYIFYHRCIGVATFIQHVSRFKVYLMRDRKGKRENGVKRRERMAEKEGEVGKMMREKGRERRKGEERSRGEKALSRKEDVCWS